MPCIGRNDTGELEPDYVPEGLLKNKLPDKSNEPFLSNNPPAFLLVTTLAPPEFQTKDGLTFWEVLIPIKPEEIPPEQIVPELIAPRSETKYKKNKLSFLLPSAIVTILASCAGLLTYWFTENPFLRPNKNINSNPPALVKIDEDEMRKLLVSTVLDFANKGCNEISIEIPANTKFKTGPMVNEAIDKTNKGKQFNDSVFFTIRVFGSNQPRPLTKKEAVLQNKKYSTLPGGITIIGSKSPRLN